MTFQSFSFLLFLGLTAVLCPAIYRRSKVAGRSALLFGCLIFYLAGGGNAWRGLCLLLAGVCFTYGAARYGRTGTARRRRFALAMAAGYHVAVLVAFKYLGFFTGGAVLVGWSPLGLSFFTFQQFWLLKELWEKEPSAPVEERLPFSDVLLHGLFFPTVSSGPILRPGAFFPQLRGERFLRPTWDDAAAALYAISLGMGKKVLLADPLGVIVRNGYAHAGDLTAVAAWLTILGYTLQLYLDFSGYCDIAAGAARLLGVRLPANFDSPYRSRSVGEFWKRWHITLTTFLRECLYFPLGGSRRGAARAYLNILIVFLVSGFWHGAGWTFLLWGLLHGLAQVAERAWGPGRENLPSPLRWGGTFLFVNAAWVFFRAPTFSAAMQVLRGAVLGGGGFPAWLTEGFFPSETEALSVLGLPGRAPQALLLAAVYLAALLIALKKGNVTERMETFRPTVWRCAALCAILTAAALSFSGVTTFIYANF